MTQSLRFRVVSVTAAAIVLGLIGSGIALCVVAHKAMYGDFDTMLESKVRGLSLLAEYTEGRVDFEFTEQGLHDFERPRRPDYYQAWLADGRVLARSPRLTGNDLDKIAGTMASPAFRAVKLPNGRAGRAVGIRFLPHVDEDEMEADVASPPLVTLVLAKDTLDIETALSHFRWTVVTVSLATCFLALLVLGPLVDYGLHPVRRLAEQIAAVDETNLSSRFDRSQVAAELAPVAGRLNGLLARLQAAFDHERAFSGDVAHELRTPLAGLSATLELALSRPRSSDEYRQAIDTCLVICAQMQSVVEVLLRAACLESRQHAIAKRTIRLDELLRECWNDFAPQADQRRVQVRWRGQPGLTVETDRDLLARVLCNLFANAVHYTDEGGQIAIETAALETACVRLRISNTGSHLRREETARVFERFWRGDKARHEAAEHAGLGLSLCQAIVEALGGTISADAPGPGLFSIVIGLPAAATAHRQCAADATAASPGTG